MKMLRNLKSISFGLKINSFTVVRLELYLSALQHKFSGTSQVNTDKSTFKNKEFSPPYKFEFLKK